MFLLFILSVRDTPHIYSRKEKNMKITPEGVKVLLTLDEFPHFCRKFHEDVRFDYEGEKRNTVYVERAGEAFRANLGDADKTERFVRLVFKWGGNTGDRVRGQMVKAQTWQEIADVVRDSVQYLDKGDIRMACRTITSLKGLGISYGSKILRMISPEYVGVYDCIIESICGYSDYPEFCEDCKNLAEVLEQRGIKNPVRDNGKWLVADVEATVFHCHRLRRG